MSQQLVELSLEETLTKATELQKLLQKLGNIKSDKLQQNTNSAQYLDLLATVLYTLNCVTHSYAQLKSVPVPEQFDTVKVYYQKIKEVLANQGKQKGAGRKIDKEVATRLINRSL